VAWRVPPQSWARDIGPWAAAFILLLWPSLVLLQWFGPIVLAIVLITVWNVTRTMQARRRQG
jgi:hypothetical protein